MRNQKKEYIQGGIYINAPDKLLFEFTQMGFISLAFLDSEPKDVLFVGLGAGQCQSISISIILRQISISRR